jgi:hypothetical protein
MGAEALVARGGRATAPTRGGEGTGAAGRDPSARLRGDDASVRGEARS